MSKVQEIMETGQDEKATERKNLNPCQLVATDQK